MKALQERQTPFHNMPTVPRTTDIKTWYTKWNKTLTVGDVGLLVPERHRPNEPLHLNRLSGETFTDKGSLGNHSLPRLGLGLSRLENLEHLVLGNSSNFGERDRVLGGSVLSSLFDGRRKRFGILLDARLKEKHVSRKTTSSSPPAHHRQFSDNDPDISTR